MTIAAEDDGNVPPVDTDNDEEVLSKPDGGGGESGGAEAPASPPLRPSGSAFQEANEGEVVGGGTRAEDSDCAGSVPQVTRTCLPESTVFLERALLLVTVLANLDHFCCGSYC